MKLVDQWRTIEENLPPDWEDVRLTLTTEQPGDLARASQVLGSIGAGKVGTSLVVHVRRGGAQGPEAARRLFARLDDGRIWCELRQAQVQSSEPPPARPDALADEAVSFAASWDASLAALPSGWTDLLCDLEVDSSDYLDRTALLCAPLNPTRDPSRLAFTFRCSGRSGYGVAPGMARRCFERLDADGITGSTDVLRVLSETDNVDTQGPVWVIGHKMV